MDKILIAIGNSGGVTAVDGYEEKVGVLYIDGKTMLVDRTTVAIWLMCRNGITKERLVEELGEDTEISKNIEDILRDMEKNNMLIRVDLKEDNFEDLLELKPRRQGIGCGYEGEEELPSIYLGNKVRVLDIEYRFWVNAGGNSTVRELSDALGTTSTKEDTLDTVLGVIRMYQKGIIELNK